jgi:prolyl-tRNA editing enzyme YbaK/EbsC (Cys-tRNA(Pro) deacylase)
LAIDQLGVSTEIKELPASTRTAPEAAQAVGCNVGQIVKSLIFQGNKTNQPILILTSGANKVEENHVSAIIGEEIKFASAGFVREETGFAIGGVSPFGLKKKILTYIDQDLLSYPLVWAAAGSHHAVFSITPELLVDKTGGEVISVY